MPGGTTLIKWPTDGKHSHAEPHLITGSAYWWMLWLMQLDHETASRRAIRGILPSCCTSRYTVFAVSFPMAVSASISSLMAVYVFSFSMHCNLKLHFPLFIPRNSSILIWIHVGCFDLYDGLAELLLHLHKHVEECRLAYMQVGESLDVSVKEVWQIHIPRLQIQAKVRTDNDGWNEYGHNYDDSKLVRLIFVLTIHFLLVI